MQGIFKRFVCVLGAFAITLGIIPTAMAQDNSMTQGDRSISVATENTIVQDESLEKTVRQGIQRETGWYPKLRIGGTAALNYNKDVNGITDGTALTFGVFIKFALDRVYKNLEWQNKIDLEHQQTKVPNIDTLIKSVDNFDVSSLLLFRIPSIEWLGPFVRVRMQTSILPSYYIADSDTTVRFFKPGTKLDGKDASLIERTRQLRAQESVKLSSAFEPILLSEAAGLFMNPYTNDLLTLNIKVGIAGQHLFSDGGYVAFDDNDKDEFYDVIKLVTTHSVGIEGEVALNGVLLNYVNWTLSAGLYYPFAVNNDQGLKGAKLIHSDISARLSFRLASWASLDYALTARLAPFVTTNWQVTNTLLFNLGFDVF